MSNLVAAFGDLACLPDLAAATLMLKADEISAGPNAFGRASGSALAD